MGSLLIDHQTVVAGPFIGVESSLGAVAASNANGVLSLIRESIFLDFWFNIRVGNPANFQEASTKKFFISHSPEHIRLTSHFIERQVQVFDVAKCICSRDGTTTQIHLYLWKR